MKETIQRLLLNLGILPYLRRLNPRTRASDMRKQAIILDFSRRFALSTLVETGTYLGEMVAAMKAHFTKIYSIELGDDLYTRAVKRFRNEKHITILHGDSGTKLGELLPTLHGPCLFWLDAHYSAGITAKGDLDTPIIRELEMIFNHEIKTHVVLVDDARLFTGTDGYPAMQTIEQLVATKSAYQIAIADDIIRIFPR